MSVEPKELEDGGQFVFNSNSHPPDMMAGGFHSFSEAKIILAKKKLTVTNKKFSNHFYVC